MFRPHAVEGARARLHDWLLEAAEAPTRLVPLEARSDGHAWLQWRLTEVGWPHTVAARLAADARANGDHAAAEVLEAVHIGLVSVRAVVGPIPGAER